MALIAEEYRARVTRLQGRVAEVGLDGFLVMAEDSIQYLLGVSYRPLERPFFIAAAGEVAG